MKPSRFLFHKRSDFCLPHFLSRRPSAAGTDPALLGGLLSSAPWPHSSVNPSPSQNFYSITRFPEIDNCSLFSLPYQIHPFKKLVPGTWLSLTGIVTPAGTSRPQLIWACYSLEDNPELGVQCKYLWRDQFILNFGNVLQLFCFQLDCEFFKIS